jgi:cobalamin-dependent methionine synthase I
MLIIGESINGTIPKVGEAVIQRNEAFLGELAITQVDCGAAVLDVNAGVAGGKEMEDLPWLVNVVQRAVSVPLMIDSADPFALKAALAEYRHAERPIVNSISGETEKWEKLFPVLVETKPRVVVLCIDDQGIPRSVEGRMRVAERLFQALVDGGIGASDIYFDPLVLSVAVEADQALVTLETIRALRAAFPDSHTVCGVSNVSMGLPARKLLNRTFLAMAVYAGLDTFFVDVRDQALVSSIYASEALANQDLYCSRYIAAYRAKKILS